MDADRSAIAAAYRDFARAADGRSPLYAEAADQIAQDEALLERLAHLPEAKRQPNLLLAAVQYLFGTPRGWPQMKGLIDANWPALETVIRARRTQTNEPARCATLLPVLAMLPQPLALLEIGASAGLCLLPDHYGYDFSGHRLAPSVAVEDPPVFSCAAGPGTPIPARNIEVAWRAGLDLNPLDCRDDDDMRWLKALVWPGEGARAALLDKAVAVARKAPPRILAGDLRHDLPALAAQAPRDATLVIYHSAVLNYVRDPAERAAFAALVRGTGARWIANETPDIFAPENRRAWPKGSFFLLSLDGKPLARTDSHGASIAWLA